MKWIVTLPDGKEVEAQGGDESFAASAALKGNVPEPESAKEKPFQVTVRRKASKPHDKPVTVFVSPHCYWFCSKFSRFS